MPDRIMNIDWYRVLNVLVVVLSLVGEGMRAYLRTAARNGDSHGA